MYAICISQICNNKYVFLLLFNIELSWVESSFFFFFFHTLPYLIVLFVRVTASIWAWTMPRRRTILYSLLVRCLQFAYRSHLQLQNIFTYMKFGHRLKYRASRFRMEKAKRIAVIMKFWIRLAHLMCTQKLMNKHVAVDRIAL